MFRDVKTVAWCAGTGPTKDCFCRASSNYWKEVNLSRDREKERKRASNQAFVRSPETLTGTGLAPVVDVRMPSECLAGG